MGSNTARNLPPALGAMSQAAELATRALTRLAAKDPTIEPNNPNHIQAYHALRQTTSRVNAVAFAQFLKSQDTQVVQSAKVTTAFWLVPKVSLPNLGPDIARAVVSKEQLLEQGAPAGSLDFSEYLVVDQIVPRDKLPLGVTEVRFSLGAVNKYKQEAGHAIGPQAAAAATGAQRSENPKPPAPAVDAGASAATGAHAPSDRCLKRVLSAEPSDVEVANNDSKRHKMLTKTLIGNAQKACEKKLWWDSDPCNSSTVHFWAKECMTAAATGADAAATGAAKDVLSGFSKLLTNILLNNACYDDLNHFVEFYEAMGTMQAELPSISILLTRLAKLTTDSTSTLDTQGANLEVRTRFFTSAVWKDFLDKRRHRRFLAAAETEDMGKRVASLRALKEDPHLPAELQAAVSAALSIFDEAIPLEEIQMMKHTPALGPSPPLSHTYKNHTFVTSTHKT